MMFRFVNETNGSFSPGSDYLSEDDIDDNYVKESVKINLAQQYCKKKINIIKTESQVSELPVLDFKNHQIPFWGFLSNAVHTKNFTASKKSLLKKSMKFISKPKTKQLLFFNRKRSKQLKWNKSVNAGQRFFKEGRRNQITFHEKNKQEILIRRRSCQCTLCGHKNQKESNLSEKSVNQIAMIRKLKLASQVIGKMATLGKEHQEKVREKAVQKTVIVVKDKSTEFKCFYLILVSQKKLDQTQYPKEIKENDSYHKEHSFERSHKSSSNKFQKHIKCDQGSYLFVIKKEKEKRDKSLQTLLSESIRKNRSTHPQQSITPDRTAAIHNRINIKRLQTEVIKDNFISAFSQQNMVSNNTKREFIVSKSNRMNVSALKTLISLQNKIQEDHSTEKNSSRQFHSRGGGQISSTLLEKNRKINRVYLKSLTKVEQQKS